MNLSNKSISDRREIVGLLSSPSFLKLADSIINSLDRNTLAEIIASYVYFKSRGRSDSEFARFIISEKFPELLFIVLRISIPVILPGMISDKKFRTVLVQFVQKSISQGRRPSKS